MATITQDAQTNIGEKTIHQERVSNPPKENSFPENNINVIATAKLFIIYLLFGFIILFLFSDLIVTPNGIKVKGLLLTSANTFLN